MGEIPKCFDCELKLQGRPMSEIGGVGKTVHYSDVDGKNFGAKEVTLYQCDICKKIALA